MKRTDAERLAIRLQAEHVDRATHRFFVRQNPDASWSVAKVLRPEQLRTPALRITTERKPHQPFADDGRSGHETRVPGLPGGIG
jgi:hypothetical protein